jgi:hypothetical protein
MGKSVTVRNGRASSLRHNDREIISENVDPSRIESNIRLVPYQSLEAAYNVVYGAALAEYNKGKKPSRQIQNLHEHWFNRDFTPQMVESPKRGKNKHGTKNYLEDVIQIGSKEDSGCSTNPVEAEKVTKCLMEWFYGNPAAGLPSWQERNPNFYCFKAWIHLDEATPHIHINYLAHSEREKPLRVIGDDGKVSRKGVPHGLSVSNSFNRALEAQSPEFGNTAQSVKLWREQETNIMVKVMERHGIDYEFKGDIDREYIEPALFREMAKSAEKAAADKAIVAAEVAYAEKREDLEVALEGIKTEKKQEIADIDAQIAEKESVLNEKAAAVESFQAVREDFRMPVVLLPNKRKELEAIVVGAVLQNAQNEQGTLLVQQSEARLMEYEDELMTKESRLADEKRYNEERVKELARREVQPLQEQINTLKVKNNSLTTENRRLSKDIELLTGQKDNKLDKVTAELERFKATAKRLGHLDEIEEHMRAVPKARGHGDR